MSLVLLPLALMYFSLSVLFDSWAPVPQRLSSGAGSDAVFPPDALVYMLM